ncbi:MAG: hypothetical protein IT370_01465 [Deltaproteobacteria bacterium]|nr:hypothetical protein [Deltaproteobacteria bacterium]
MAEVDKRVPDTAAIHALLRRTRGRLRLQGALEWATTGAIVAINLALVGLFLWKLGRLSDAALVWTFVAGGALVAGAAVAGAVRAVADGQVAKRLDRTAELADRLGTALEFERQLRGAKGQPVEHQDFKLAAIEDAVRHASKASPKAAAPLRRPRDLGALGVIAAAACVLALVRLPLSREEAVIKAPPAPVAETQPQGYEVDAVRDYLDALKDTAIKDDNPDLAEMAKKIAALLDQLERGEIDKKELFEQLAALEAEHLAGPDDAEMQEALTELEDLGKELAKDKATQQLGEALKEGDLQKAQDELEKLGQQAASEKDPKKQEALAKALEKISQTEEKLAEQKLKKSNDEKLAELKKDIAKLEKELAKKDEPEKRAELEDKKRELERLMKKDAAEKADKAEADKQKQFEDEIKKLAEKTKDCTPAELEQSRQDLAAGKKPKCDVKAADELEKKRQELAKLSAEKKEREQKAEQERQAQKDKLAEQIRQLEKKAKENPSDQKTQAELERKRDLERLMRQDEHDKAEKAEKAEREKFESEIKKLERAQKLQKCTPEQIAQSEKDEAAGKKGKCDKLIADKLGKLKRELKKLEDKKAERDKQREDDRTASRKKFEEEKRRLEKKLQDNPKDQEARRQLDKNKRQLDRLERDKKEQQQAQKQQKRQLQRLSRDLKRSAENMRNQKPEDAKDDLDDAKDEVGKMEDEIRKLSGKKKAKEQMGSLREALRRAQKKQRGEGGQQGGRKGQKLRDFYSRAAGQPGNAKVFQPGQGSKPGQEGEGQQPGGVQPGAPGGQQPGGEQAGNGPPKDGSGGQPGGGIGSDHDPNVLGGATKNKVKYAEKELEGVKGKGPSRSQVIQSAAQKGFASRAYEKVYTDYQAVVDDVMNREKVPLGYRHYIERYFKLIKPRQ